MKTYIGSRWRFLWGGVLGFVLGITCTHIWYSPLLTDTTRTVRILGDKLDATEDESRTCSANLAAAGKTSQELSANSKERVTHAEQALALAQEELDRAKHRTQMAERWTGRLSQMDIPTNSPNLCDKLDALLTDTIERRRGQ